MRKNISTQALKANIGEVVDAVRLRGDRYVVLRRGRPVAAVVPLNVNEAFEQKQGDLFALMETVSRRNVGVPGKTVGQAVAAAVREVRSRRKRTRRP